MNGCGEGRVPSMEGISVTFGLKLGECVIEILN